MSKLADALGVTPDAAWLSFATTIRGEVAIDESTKSLPSWSGAPARTKRPRGASLDWADEVRTLYGERALLALVARADDEGNIGFWNVRLLPHAYPIGVTTSGDPIVQVATGRYAGHVLVVNHEAYHGFLTDLARKPPKTDQLVRLILGEENDAGWRIAKSFAELYTELSGALAQRGRAGSREGGGVALSIETTELPITTAYEAPTLYVEGDAAIAGGRTSPDSRTTPTSLFRLSPADGYALHAFDTTATTSGAVRGGDGMFWRQVRDLKRSRDGGATFESVVVEGAPPRPPLEGLSPAIVRRASLLGASPRGVFIALAGEGRSHVYDVVGERASERGTFAGVRVDGMFETSSGALLSFTTDGIVRSADGGASWTAAGGPRICNATCGAELPDGSILVGATKTLLRSTDDGRSFEAAARLKEDSRNVAVRLGASVLLLNGSLLLRIGLKAPGQRKLKPVGPRAR